MVAGIFTNLLKDKDELVTKELILLFKENGISYYLHEKMQGIIDEKEYFSFEKPLDIDVLVSIGGDGTILGLVDFCVKNNIYIIGINKGRVGFLNEIDPGDLSPVIPMIKDNIYLVDERRLLEVSGEGEVHYGLNEIILYRTDEAKIVTLEVRVQEQLLDRYACDGFIVSTPTGSTAYSLSAGGPILSPFSKTKVLTPINSHSLRSKPVVIAENEPVELKLTKRNNGAKIMVDGICAFKVESGQPVVINGSSKSIKFLRRENDFYSKLLAKLSILGAFEE